MATATAVFRRYETRERSREDDCRSETSTVKGSVFRPGSSDSVRTFGGMRYVKSATRVGTSSRTFKCDQYNSDSDEETFEYDDTDNYDGQTDEVQKPSSVTRVSRIDLSPEAELKRTEAYNKWLNSVVAREKARKRLSRERLAAEIEARKESQEELKAKSEEKVDEWMRKKRIEADKKTARLREMEKKMILEGEKPKEFKKAINFQDWLNLKNDELMVKKKQTAENKKKPKAKEIPKRRESISHEQWLRTSSSKAKPVPLNRGLDSLKGSTTKLYINPEPWKFED